MLSVPNHMYVHTLMYMTGMICRDLKWCLMTRYTVFGTKSSTRFRYTSSFWEERDRDREKWNSGGKKERERRWRVEFLEKPYNNQLPTRSNLQLHSIWQRMLCILLRTVRISVSSDNSWRGQLSTHTYILRMQSHISAQTRKCPLATIPTAMHLSSIMCSNNVKSSLEL